MSRPLGGYVGYDAEPATDAAPGIWTLREAEFYKRKAQWPIVFVPSDITGLQLWLDASDASTLYDATTGGSLVAADGGVARWEDKSGNNRHPTQATAGSRPARKTAIQNGLDVMRFDGSDDALVIPSSTSFFNFAHETAFTAFVAFAKEAQAELANLLVGNNYIASSQRGFMFFVDDRDATVGAGGNALRTIVSSADGASGPDRLLVEDIGPVNSVSDTAFQVVSTVVDHSNTGASRSQQRVNGSALAQNNTYTRATVSGDATNDLVIGGVNSFFLDGDIAEIIIYDSALSDTDREAVESYLTAKWGIT